ncbi:MAG: putative oxidoreductase [Patescibacteria group bacterium]|nr:putative oxidoreductase [Patescibacteria group bacterium]
METEGKIGKYLNNLAGNSFYPLFRIIVGGVFFLHGIQKVLGAFGGIDGLGGTPPLLGMVGLAGIIETFAGILVAAGIFTRFFAAIATVEMLVAYLTVHFPNGVNPFLNGGELALLFFASFLAITRYGSGKWSLEKLMLGKEIF